jgi:multicomponent Na+:H+ antiporter subunit C
MDALYAVVVGFLFAIGVYLILQRPLVKLLLGIAVLGNAANLMIFVSSGARRLPPPLIPDGEKVVTPPIADPIAQALILTAIVIGFGVLAFAVVLVHRVHQTSQIDGFDELTEGVGTE